MVRLDDAPASGGYAWHIDYFDDHVLVEAGSQFEPPPEDSPIGAAGHRTFAFKAANPGAARITLSKWRQWEGPSSSVERFEVVVQVL